METKNGGLFQRFKDGLARTRQALSAQFAQVFKESRKAGPELWDELEEVLIRADLGIEYTTDIIAGLKLRFKHGELIEEKEIRGALYNMLIQEMRVCGQQWPPDEKLAVLILGVNGVGKTTTIGKLAHQITSYGKKVMLAAGDTFRAAAAEQLALWAERTKTGIISHREGADPAAVAFDAMNAAKARKIDVVLIDTAGRLHTKANLMEELKKIRRVVTREAGEYTTKNWLVLDATTGQNALAQAKAFHEAIPLDGLIMTKMDGTAKGGIALTIAHRLKLPLLFVGVGEGMEDLKPVEPKSFVAAILDEEEEHLAEYQKEFYP